MRSLTHLDRLEAESIHIMRETVAEAERPVMLYSIGKDSAVMLHLAKKAFFPSPLPFPLLHVDTTWKFRDMYALRDKVARGPGDQAHRLQEPRGRAKGINPFDHGPLHTDMWKTEGLKQALDTYGFDAAFGGARRDEEKSRAKERVFSFRDRNHRWDPKRQRPELWSLYNVRKNKGESIRVFPLSNWTELDVWQYILREKIEIVPLYFAAERPTVERDGLILMVDDERFPMNGEKRGDAQGPLPHARLLPAFRRGRERGRDGRGDRRRDAADQDVGAAGPGDRPRRRQRVDGEEEAGGIFLMARPLESDEELIRTDVRAWLAQQEAKELLRFITCGSVDDGKSTLIGRLLYESKQIFDDQLAALESDSKRHGTQGEKIDFALLVDGLSAEREQGITIDVAYRFFSSARRKFIVADTPGHEQYTRNMVTGASTADLAVLLVDARKGVLTQTRRHSYLAQLVGIRRFVLAVNKMDLVDYDQAAFDAICADYRAFAEQDRDRGLGRRSRCPASMATMS